MIQETDEWSDIAVAEMNEPLSEQEPWIMDKIVEKSARPLRRGIYEVHDQGPLAHLVSDSSGIPTRSFRSPAVRGKSRWDDLLGDDPIQKRIEEARETEYRAPVKELLFIGNTVDQAVRHARIWGGRVERLPEEVRVRMLKGEPAPSMERSDRTELGLTTPSITETPQ